jgi:hypothetical protein
VPGSCCPLRLPVATDLRRFADLDMSASKTLALAMFVILTIVDPVDREHGNTALRARRSFRAVFKLSSGHLASLSAFGYERVLHDEVPGLGTRAFELNHRQSRSRVRLPTCASHACAMACPLQSPSR